MQKKRVGGGGFRWVGVWWGGSGLVGGQGVCERRIEIIMKMHKKVVGGGRVGGSR